MDCRPLRLVRFTAIAEGCLAKRTDLFTIPVAPSITTIVPGSYVSTYALFWAGLTATANGMSPTGTQFLFVLIRVHLWLNGFLSSQ
jgi:hypothetical protein